MKVTTDACLFGSLTPTLSKEEGDLNVLDIGTGTGLLSLFYAQKNPKVKIDAIEIDSDAAAQAKENAAASPWKDRIHIYHGDARSYSFPHPYDLIISNPPFYQNELKSQDNKNNIARHSEELSLPELIRVIKENMAPEGQFFILLPYKRISEARLLLNKYFFEITQTILVRQSVLNDVFRIIIGGKHGDHDLEDYKKIEIAICDGQQQYTPEFIELLKEYYLKL